MKIWLPNSISYKFKDSTNEWHLVLALFRPRDEDFKHMIFKINGKIYTKPSPEFYKEFEKIALWHFLSNNQ